jgi:hypothetical protein
MVYYTDVDYTLNELLVPGGTNGTGAELVNLGDGYYLPSSSNIGTGTINDLTLTNNSAPTETVTIKCVSAQRNNLNQIIPGTADFTVIGSVSGAAYDGYKRSILGSWPRCVYEHSIEFFYYRRYYFCHR